MAGMGLNELTAKIVRLRGFSSPVNIWRCGGLKTVRSLVVRIMPAVGHVV